MGVDGKYTIETDHGMLTSKASEASVFVSGSPDKFYKAGLYESTEWPMPKALTQVAPGIYRMTLKAGSNIHPTKLNFKFYSSENWGGLTFNTLTGMAADKLVVSDGNDGYDEGNIHYKDGASLTEGATYIVTINTADMSLDMQMQYDITDMASLETAISEKENTLSL